MNVVFPPSFGTAPRHRGDAVSLTEILNAAQSWRGSHLELPDPHSITATADAVVMRLEVNDFDTQIRHVLAWRSTLTDTAVGVTISHVSDWERPVTITVAGLLGDVTAQVTGTLYGVDAQQFVARVPVGTDVDVDVLSGLLSVGAGEPR